MFTGNRAYGCALIPNRNDKKVKQILNLCFKRIWNLGETKTSVYDILTKDRELLLSYKMYHINAFLIYNKNIHMPLIKYLYAFDNAKKSRDKTKTYLHINAHQKKTKTKLNTKYTRFST